jgi:DNA-binding response OmpR family regulator
MKIAIVENDSSFVSKIKARIRNETWQIDYFKDTKHLGIVDIKKYDVIICDFSLPEMTGRDLINAIAEKTNAQLFLMSITPNNFTEEDVENEKIIGLIDRSKPEDLIEQLKYINSKLKIEEYSSTIQVALNDVKNSDK